LGKRKHIEEILGKKKAYRRNPWEKENKA